MMINVVDQTKAHRVTKLLDTVSLLILLMTSLISLTLFTLLIFLFYSNVMKYVKINSVNFA